MNTPTNRQERRRFLKLFKKRGKPRQIHISKQEIQNFYVQKRAERALLEKDMNKVLDKAVKEA